MSAAQTIEPTKEKFATALSEMISDHMDAGLHPYLMIEAMQEEIKQMQEAEKRSQAHGYEETDGDP